MKINKKSVESLEKIVDPRFQTVHYDPKFLPAAKKISKTAIDARFEGLFTDKRFNIVSEKDKYGRDIAASNDNQDMKRLYYLEGEEQEQNDENENRKKLNKKKEKKESHEENQQQKKKNKKIKEKLEDDPNDKKKKKKNPKIQGELMTPKEKPSENRETSLNSKKKPNKNISKTEEIQQKYYNSNGKFEWNEESSSESGESLIPVEENVWEDEEDHVIRNENSSTRLALMNYDWSHLNAEDLMVLFNSLKPKSGSIHKVTVYPSEFGLKHMEIEEKEGPKEIWEEEENQELEKEKKKEKKHKKIEREVNDWIAKANKPTEFDPIKLRKYEKDRLKYYYAIIECDNKETAEHIYEQSDGTEFELSGMKLDLRFVPDGQKFPYEPKEICDYLPSTNKVNNFLNRALNHTNVELTWENPDMNRFDFLYNKNMKDEDWDKIDYSKILGEADISEPDEDEQIPSEKKQIEEEELEEDDDWRADFDKKKKRKGEEEMEIRFSSGFQDIGNKLLEKKKEKEESTWEKYLKKKKEKKKMRKMMEKNKMKEEDYFVEPENDEKEIQKYGEELELLVDDDKRNKRGDFNADVADERFRAIYEDSRFGINPTHKDFKVEGSGKYLKEVVERRKKIKKNK